LFVTSLRQSIYSLNSVKLLGKFALIDDSFFQVVHKVDRSVIINIFRTSNDFVLNLVCNESVSLADDTDYHFWHTTLGHLFKVNVN
jgi:hypothetical protein